MSGGSLSCAQEAKQANFLAGWAIKFNGYGITVSLLAKT